MRRTAVVVLVALVVVTAGCGTFDSSPEPDPDPDREPYEVDDEFEPRLVPGLTEDGVSDGAALANEHYRTLEGSFHGEYRVSVGESESNETVEEGTRTITADVRETETEYDPAHVGGDSETIIERHTWADSDVQFTRQVNASGAVTYYPDAPLHSTEPSLPVSLLELYGDIETVTVDRANDTERYRLAGAGDFAPVENASYELVLAESGYVDQYHIEGIQERNGERTAVVYRGGFEALDDPDLEVPAWLEEAEDATEGPTTE
ncbi:hypothetical protein GS429_11335 [Natronorubrum sp. JWXQ-INN-674]|uniref:Uncharacterized protein n=1 Tax=Natronorubrum halalkaliphilum TaxID=2691917 RepID=A0A6B0VNU2_9EURY|nr:hypothetical protein [Natronorubrum halalkaliphilum]MXV62646.1 hypothetical protein [Natronorubrum halalkaliphilum]